MKFQVDLISLLAGIAICLMVLGIGDLMFKDKK